MSLLESLSTGLRGAAGILSPDVQKQTFQQDQQNSLLQQQQKMQLLQHIQQQVQAGAVPADKVPFLAQRLGVPAEFLGGPSLATQKAQGDIVKDREAQERDAMMRQELIAAGGDRARMRDIVMKYAKPADILKMKTEGGYTLGADQIRYDADNNPVATGPAKPERPSYKERKVSYDGSTYVMESSNDGGITWSKIDGSKPVDIRKASGGSDINVRVDSGNPTGVTDKTDRRKVVESLRGQEALIQDLTTFLKDVNTTPGGTGARGWVGQKAAGIAEQIGGAGPANAVSKTITGGTPQQIAQLRVRSQMLTAKLLPVVTNENGRFTEPEREMARQAQGALDVAQGPTQVKAATKVLIMLAAADRERNLKDLGVPQKHNLGNEAGFLAQTKEFKLLGLDDGEAIKATRLLREVRAQ